jgi:hypothetical protein
MKLFGFFGVHAMDLLPCLQVTMRNEKRLITKGKKTKNTLTATISYVITTKRLLEIIKSLS